jgi:hypothetical protein
MRWIRRTTSRWEVQARIHAAEQLVADLEDEWLALSEKLA